MTGLVVRVESMKFREAQNRPESALVNVNHLSSALRYALAYLSVQNIDFSTLHSSLPPPKPTALRQSLLLSHLPRALRPNSQHPIYQD